MKIFWKKAVSKTRSVAVIAFIIVTLIMNVYKDETIKLLGSSNAFYITMGIIVLLTVALIIAIFIHRHPPSEQTRSKPHKVQKTKISNSKVEGDIVLGNKTINENQKSGK